MIYYSSKFTYTFLDFPDPYDASILVMILKCEHNCKGCHSKELKDCSLKGTDQFKKGYSGTLLQDLYNYSNRTGLNQVVLCGGDPLHPDNRKDVLNLIKVSKNLSYCIYTGYTLKELESVKDHIKGNVDYLICGRYDETKKQKSEKTDDYFQLASSNQKIYNKDLELISENGKLNFN